MYTAARALEDKGEVLFSAEGSQQSTPCNTTVELHAAFIS
jgi:hypothetical protein